MIIDTHAHLYQEYYKNNVDKIINDALNVGVKKIICIGVDLPTSHESIRLSKKFDSIYASVGIHPHDTKDAGENYNKSIKDLASFDKVVAIGETGLDFHYNLSDRNIQIESFNKHLEIAKELDLPCIVHSRNADEEIYNILNDHSYSKVVVHCFSSNKDFAKKISKLGIFISVTGLSTFAGRELEDAIRCYPIDRIMLETDSPYLAPIPKRGKQNQPKYITYIADKVASIKGVSTDSLIKKTSDNAIRFFNL